MDFNMDIINQLAVVLLVLTISICMYYYPTMFIIVCLLTGALLWFIAHKVGIVKSKRVLDQVLRFLRMPVGRRQRILNSICGNESTASVIPAHIYNPPLTRFGVPSTLGLNTAMNRSQPCPSESPSPTSSSSKVTLARGGSSSRERSNFNNSDFHHTRSKLQLNQNMTPSKRAGSFFAAPRDRPVGVKTCHAVAGPTLASTRFKQNLDYCVYADVNSPGFTDRIASYHQEANSETPSSGYTSPGQFPSVKLAKDNVRLVTMKNRPKPYIPVSVRIAPPITDYTSPTRFERPKEEKRETPTQSVLDALKEISRKRIHGEADDNDPNKRYKSDGQEALTSSAEDSRVAGEAGNKRGRDVSPEKRPSSAQSPFAKRVCSNEIASSLSSTQRFNDKKRKAAAVVITSQSPGPGASKKKIALSVDDVEYDLTAKATSTGILDSKCPQPESDATQRLEKSQTDAQKPLTPVAESSQPLRPLFGKPTSPEINTAPKEKRSPVFATMQTEKTSSAELTSRQLRQKKLQRLFNAIKKDELEAKAENSSNSSTKESTPSVSVASLVSSTLLTTAITSPVVSTAQQDVLAQLGIGSASSTTFKTTTGEPVASVVSSSEKTESSLPPYSFGSGPSNVNIPSTSTLSSQTHSLTTIGESTTPKPSLSSTASLFASMPGLSSIVLPTLSTPSATTAVSAADSPATASMLSSSFGLPTASTPTSMNFMKNLLTTTPKTPSTSEQVSSATAVTGTPNFGSISFGASTAISTVPSPSTSAPQLGAPPVYGSLPTCTLSVKSAAPSSFVTPDGKQASFASTSTPTFETSSSTLPVYGSTSSPYTTAPPAYGSTSAVNTTSNISPFVTNSSAQHTFGIASKPLDANTSAPNSFSTANLSFPATTTTQQSFGAVNIPGAISEGFNTPPTALPTNSTTPLFGSSTTSHQAGGFSTEAFSFGGQKTVETPGFGTSTSTNPSQASALSGTGFAFGSTTTSSNSAFHTNVPATTETGGLFQFGQTATTNSPNTFGQPSSTTFGSTSAVSPPFGQTTVSSSPFGQSANTPTAFGQATTASPFGQTGTTVPTSNTTHAFGQDTANASSKPLFGGFTFGDPVPTSATGDFGSANSKTGIANIFGAPPNQSPFQQGNTSSSVNSPLSLASFTAASNAIGGFSFPTNITPTSTGNSNPPAFAFGSSAPAESTGFNFNSPAAKPAESFGFTSPQQPTFAFGSQQQQTTPAYGSDPNAISTPAFGQGSSGGTFQFNASTAQQQQHQGVFNFGTVPPSAGSNYTQFGATTSNISSPFNFGLTEETCVKKKRKRVVL